MSFQNISQTERKIIMRVQYDVMVQEFTRVLEKRDSIMRMQKCSSYFCTEQPCRCVLTWLNRFPRVVSYLEKGEIDPNAKSNL